MEGAAPSAPKELANAIDARSFLRANDARFLTVDFARCISSLLVLGLSGSPRVEL